jgi:hypothetical protein
MIEVLASQIRAREVKPPDFRQLAQLLILAPTSR